MITGGRDHPDLPLVRCASSETAHQQERRPQLHLGKGRAGGRLGGTVRQSPPLVEGEL